MKTMTRRRVIGCCCLVLPAAGCGMNVNELLYQSSSAVTYTVLDLLLTDLANQIADALAPPDEDPGNGDPNGGNGNGNGGGPDIEDLIGDPASGETLFTANNCATCHCADGSGGCALSAPAVAPTTLPLMVDFLRGSTPHPLKPPLSNQDIVDMTAYLNSL